MPSSSIGRAHSKVLLALLAGPLLSIFGSSACGSDAREEPSAPSGGRAVIPPPAQSGSAPAGNQTGGRTNSGNSSGASSGRGGSANGGVSPNGGTRVSTGGTGGTTSQVAQGGMPEPNWPVVPVGTDGVSPYLRECHGETVECQDPKSLTCLGIRDEKGVQGFACSNTCETNADCAAEATGVGAKPSCIDFAISRYCMLACTPDDSTNDCPSGMACYVYPGTTAGYCLWR
ncbi:MAG TPA: hypothetical protein VFQ61_23145 [Polyangiaceae bacterium]|nr:hypothetical protein [Polyangiaceae bacterium]